MGLTLSPLGKFPQHLLHTVIEIETFPFRLFDFYLLVRNPGQSWIVVKNEYDD